jgi:hypothetical protein
MEWTTLSGGASSRQVPCTLSDSLNALQRNAFHRRRLADRRCQHRSRSMVSPPHPTCPDGQGRCGISREAQSAPSSIAEN